VPEPQRGVRLPLVPAKAGTQQLVRTEFRWSLPPDLIGGGNERSAERIEQDTL